jgi:hypothetical protein
MTHRYNPFLQIHKGLRAMLYETALNLQHADFGNVAATALVTDQVQKVLWLFEGHAHIEDSKVFPLIATHAPEVVDDFESQHVQDHALGEALQQQLDKLAACEHPTERKLSGLALQQAFQCFVAFNLEHMVKEETIVASLLWEHYTDQELHALTEEIVRNIPPEKNQHYVNWMILGNNDEELIQWLTSVRNSAPSFVYDQLCDLAKQLLKTARWEKVSSALAEAPLVLN